MEFIRSRIETQLMSLTGLSLGQLDLENPKGDPGLFGPDSVAWRVNGETDCTTWAWLVWWRSNKWADARFWVRQNHRQLCCSSSISAVRVKARSRGDRPWALSITLRRPRMWISSSWRKSKAACGNSRVALGRANGRRLTRSFSPHTSARPA